MIARPPAVVAALLVPLLPAPAAAPAARAAGLDFPKLKAELLERCEGAGSVDELLAGFEHTRLGAFDVYFPSYALKEYGELHDDARRALVDVQREWLELLAGEQAAERGDELAGELNDWIASRDRKAEPTEACGELRALLSSPEALGFAPVRGQGARIVLAPDRRDFQRLVAFFGEADPSLRGLYWHDGVKVWTEFWWNDIQVVALEYPPATGDSDDPGDGIRMDFREPSGLEQHVAQRGAMGLVWHTFGDGLPPAIEMGLAQLLVVEAYGENNVRSGGSVRGSETEAFEAFIPGGNPSGGFLPPISADSPWRADKGKDHFVKVLRASQKAGSKGAPHPGPDGEKPKKSKHDKLAWFLLQAGSGSHPVRAPFLGQVSLGKLQPPAAFGSDYMEFFRAYKTAFLHWLATAGAGGKQDSAAAWHALAAAIATAGGEGDFEALAAEVYGMPLSAHDGPDKDQEESLEWAFLTWLSKQR